MVPITTYWLMKKRSSQIHKLSFGVGNILAELALSGTSQKLLSYSLSVSVLVFMALDQCGLKLHGRISAQRMA
jgi:hypothetical protein